MKHLKIKLVLIATIILFNCGGSKSIQSESEIQPYFFAFIVKDIELSKKWYISRFNLKVAIENENAERGFKQAALKNDNMMIELIQTSTAATIEEISDNKVSTRSLIGIFKIGFSVEHFDELVEQLANQNTEVYGKVVTDPVSNKKMLIVLDPDKNRIQIFEK